MKILFHLPIIPPKNPKFEAYSQEIEILSRRYEGQTIFINPNRHLPAWLPLRIPRLLFGFHLWSTLRRLDQETDIHQIYNPDPYYYPILSFLKKPVVYVASSSIPNQQISSRFFRSLTAVAVYDKRSLKNLKQAGIQNAFHIQSGIDTEHFTQRPLPIRSQLRLLMASAPWVASHFQSKGIDALLAALQQMPDVHLTLLWRGVLLDEIQQRVATLGLAQQVTIVDKLVDINQTLATVHGTVLLATHGEVVKAYPHSLLDSLAAGKPVIVSRSIPMSDYVEDHKVGSVVEEISPATVIRSINAFRSAYPELSGQAEQQRAKDFTVKTLLDSYERVYSYLC